MNFVDVFNKLYPKLEKEIMIKYKNIENKYYTMIHLKSENDINRIDKERDCVATFDCENYLKKILESYKYNKNKIWEQYCMDFPRSSIYIDNRKIKNKMDLIQILKTLNYDTINIDDLDMDLMIIVIMLSCQSSYGFSYIFLHNLYYDKNKMVCNKSTNRRINFNLNPLSVTIETDFSVKNISKNKIISIINTNLYVQMDKNNKFHPKGIFTWNILQT